MSSTVSYDTLPSVPLRRQSAPNVFPARRSSTPTSLSSIHERAPTMIAIDEEPVAVVVEPPKGNTLHHLPIIFALLPAAAGLFVGGGEKWTDVMLLGLAGVYLNWLVKCIPPLCIAADSVPWEWYHASRTLRLMSDSQASPMPFFTRTEGFVSTPEQTSAIVSEDEDETPTPSHHHPGQPLDPEAEAAAINLRRTEILALISCVASPLIGGYLLHYIREILSRPSEGLVSTFNITLFVMAAELRPAMKLMEMIKQRSLYLQKIVHKDVLEGNVNNPTVDIEPLNRKIEQLENTIEELRMSVVRVQGGREEVVSGVREGVRADVEALNRAVRRYEKSFALHRAHTEDRINLLSSRVNDLSLVVSDTNQTPHGIIYLILTIPEMALQLIQSLIALPGVLLKRVLRILLGVRGKSTDKGAGVNKGKAVKGSKSSAKKRVSTGRSD